MADDPEDLTPAEERVRSLLGELREEPARDGEALTRSVVRTARWQRPVRRVLLALGSTAGAVATGVDATWRAYKRR